MKKYFQHSKDNPYHISVGAVLMNSKGQIACHYFRSYSGYKHLYILMKESMEVGECPEDTVHRGLMEEFGATAEILGYIGSTVEDHKDDYDWQKTTLYFLCNLKHQDLKLRDPNDDEKDSEVQWHNPEKLVGLMQKYKHVIDGVTINESEVIKRALDFKSEQK